MRNRRIASRAWLRTLCLGTMTMPMAFPTHLGAAAGSQTGTWTTRPEYRIDEPEGAAGGFGAFSRLRVDGTGMRLVVQDAEIVVQDAAIGAATPIWKILVCSLEGVPLVTLGPEDLPGRFGPPSGIRADMDGFMVRDLDGSLKYSYEGRNLIETVMYPPELRRVTRVDGGGFLTRERMPNYDPRRQNPAPQKQAVLRLTDAGNQWQRDTMVVLDIRHSAWFAGIRGQGSPPSYHVFSVSQPFSDHDLTWFDSRTGNVGVVRRNGVAGAVEVFEVGMPGDTVWHRRFLLPTVPLAPERAEAAIEKNLSGAASAGVQGGLTRAELRRLVEDAMYIPGHLPTVVAFVATASGEIWLKTPEVARGQTVWYSVRRGDDDTPARRVLLPATFKLQDAVGDHVWGFSEEPSRPRRVVGLRVVPLR